jgi:hypothetical protein
MALMRNVQLAGAVLGSSLALAAGLVVACSNSSNPAPVQPVYTVEAGGDSSSPDSASPPETGPSETSAPGLEGGEASATDASDAGSCSSQLTDAGCWTCPTRTDASLEYLNQCSGTGVHCAPFNNAVLPGYDASGLPPL